jgi:tetratricopeptide (TPR) repeat protein
MRSTITIALVLLARSALAQPLFELPDASPRAEVSQTVGLTEITISYHRPAVKKRKIWGGLVPWGEVWRAGANENTTIRFSTPVTVGGKTLAPGRYGLHTLPTEKGWTVILSHMADAWGSYTYDAKEDAVRVAATAQPAPFEERLAYTFDDVSDGAVTVSLRWDKLRVPFKIEVDTPQVVVASLREHLRGRPRFFAQGWSQAAAWCLEHDVNLPEALQWADKSLSLAETYAGLKVKAGLLDKKGDGKGAAALREKALGIANENELNLAAYEQLGKGKTDDAIALFQRNVKQHPESWNAYDSLGEGFEKKGDKKQAIESYGKALSMATDAIQKKRIEGVLARLRGK